MPASRAWALVGAATAVLAVHGGNRNVRPCGRNRGRAFWNWRRSKAGRVLTVSAALAGAFLCGACLC